MALAFKTAHGTYLTAEQNTGRVSGDRPAIGRWEAFTVERISDTHVALKTSFGTYLTAEEGGGRELACNRTERGAWEVFGYWVRPDGSVALRAANQQWVRVGSGEEGYPVTATKDGEPEAYEVFAVEEIADQPDHGAHPFPLGPGILRARGDGYAVSGRPVHALGYMGGDLFLCHSEGKDIAPALDAGMRAGYGYFGPTWNPLVKTKGSGGPFWGDRALSPFVHGYDWWYDVTRSACRMVIERGMKVFMANGGLHLFTNEEESQVYHGLKDIQSELGADNFFMTGYVNEPRDTGDADDRDPREIERLVNIIRAAHPDNQYGLGSYTGDTQPEDVSRFTTSWMDSWCTYHGYRDGHYWDKLRHLQNNHYENYIHIRPCFVNDEDFGPQGHHGHLSVQRNDHELDKHVMILAASIAMQGRCAYSFTCSPGILFDEPFEHIPGFMEVPGFVHRHVPADIGTYEHLIHSGAGQDARRVFRALNNLRVDGRVRSDGHFYFTAYGPPEDATSQIEVDKSAEFDLINTSEEVFHFSLSEGQRIPEVPVDKGYVLRGRLR